MGLPGKTARRAVCCPAPEDTDGVQAKTDDMTVNACKRKQLSNTRASGSDDALRLTPPRQMSLEQCLEFLADDELLEVTPKNLRIRKRILNHADRMKAMHGKK